MGDRGKALGTWAGTSSRELPYKLQGRVWGTVLPFLGLMLRWHSQAVDMKAAS